MATTDPLNIPPLPKAEAKPKTDSKPGAQRGRPRAKLPSLEQEIYGLLMMANMPVSMLESTRPYKLLEVEMKALAVTINDTAVSNPKIYTYVKSFLGVGKNAGILVVVGAVVGRRAVMAGAVPGVDPSSADDLLMPLRVVASLSTVKVPQAQVDEGSSPPPAPSPLEPESSPAPVT